MHSCPFSTEVVTQRSSSWADAVDTHFYVYPVHPSGQFLLTSSLAAAFYLALMRMLSRQYELVCRIIDASCHSDAAFTPEMRWVMTQVLRVRSLLPPAIQSGADCPGATASPPLSLSLCAAVTLLHSDHSVLPRYPNFAHRWHKPRKATTTQTR